MGFAWLELAILAMVGLGVDFPHGGLLTFIIVGHLVANVLMVTLLLRPIQEYHARRKDIRGRRV